MDIFLCSTELSKFLVLDMPQYFTDLPSFILLLDSHSFHKYRFTSYLLFTHSINHCYTLFSHSLSPSFLLFPLLSIIFPSFFLTLSLPLLPLSLTFLSHYFSFLSFFRPPPCSFFFILSFSISRFSHSFCFYFSHTLFLSLSYLFILSLVLFTVFLSHFHLIPSLKLSL